MIGKIIVVFFVLLIFVVLPYCWNTYTGTYTITGKVENMVPHPSTYMREPSTEIWLSDGTILYLRGCTFSESLINKTCSFTFAYRVWFGQTLVDYTILN